MQEIVPLHFFLVHFGVELPRRSQVQMIINSIVILIPCERNE